MNFATISGDIISSTSLANKDKRKLEQELNKLISELSNRYSNAGFFGRILQGDYIECAMNLPHYALRITLLFKTFIKSLNLPSHPSKDKRIKLFKEHGVRLSLAIGPLEVFDRKKGIIDGEAIQLSGRTLKNQSTSGKEKVVIKETIYFNSSKEETAFQFEPVIALLDVILSRCSAKQCEVLYHKLSGKNEEQIARILNKYQSTINQHSRAAGWYAIEKAVNHFEKYFA